MVGFSDVTDQSVRRLRWFNLKSRPHDNRSFFALTPFAAASIGSFGRSKIGTAFCQKKYCGAVHGTRAPLSAQLNGAGFVACLLPRSSLLLLLLELSQSLRAGCMGCMGVRGVQPHRSGSCHSTIGSIPPFAWACPCSIPVSSAGCGWLPLHPSQVLAAWARASKSIAPFHHGSKTRSPE